MAIPIAKHAFTVGEISPYMLGRQDVERYQAAGTTVRNFIISYVGPLLSRAGTAFVGFSKQTGRSYPPRLIPFQFATNQALALEFGNFYMRAISNGAYVTETPIAITNVANDSPCQVTIAQALGVSAATPVNTGVISSYSGGDTVTLAGGTYTSPGVLTVTNTTVLSLSPYAAGTGYVPGNTITFAGGTFSSQAVGTVQYTQVVSAVIAGGGSGGTPGAVTLTGTTGTGTKFQCTGTINGSGVLASLTSITAGGVYSVNPTTLTNEPVTGGGLTGAALSITMGIQALTVSTAGVYTVNPVADKFTQASTSGSGTGAATNALFGPHAVSVTTAGQYSSFPSSPASQATTSGAGVGATFNLTSTSVAAPLNAGDWIYVSGVGGTTQINGETFVIGTIVGQVVTLYDVYGAAVDSTAFGAYTSGGAVARVYTLTTPYGEADLDYLKITQSADTLSICCVNTVTNTEYAPQDLTRTTDVNWAFFAAIPAPLVTPPTSVSGSATASGSVNYEYVVTSLDPVTGTESIASSIASIPSAVDIAATAGSITLTWTPVTGVNEYYVYKASPGYGAPVPAGTAFGYAGVAYGASFVDSNITADFAQAPPTHQNPFGRGIITGTNVLSGGSGYTSITLAISTSTGSGGVLTGILSSGSLVAIVVANEGIGYAPGDAINIAGVGGSGAAAQLVLGPQSGTYPSVPAYFQERRGYANSLNHRDTYWFSQPGAFTNFDTRNPTIASDAITGSPWSVQVNGVQWMIQTQGGLLIMTGLRAWMLVGAGSFATNVQPISPSSQNDVPQAFSGCSPLVQPIVVNYDVLYVDQNGAWYYDLPYQTYTLSEPTDLTDVSEHLFDGYTVVANCYCEKPYRLVWSVRSDGALLSLTYYKTQKIQGWARHDTQGFFVGCCSVTEPPVAAAYFATQRFIGGNTAYMIERMDDRLWQNVEDVWAVDCALAYPQPTPAAKLTISSALGLGSITGATGIVGGAGYSSATTGSVADLAGVGSGAVPTLTISGGALTGVTFAGGSQGSGYQQPALMITDPAGSAGGSGASAKLTLTNTTTLTASAAVFSMGSVGSVVRAAGGIAVITAYTSTTQVTANVLVPFPNTIPGTSTVPTIAQGEWTMTAPITTVSGLRHLAGATVTGLADGNVIAPTTVSAAGTITLGTAASAITVGLGFTCQFQDVPLDMGNPTVQAQRKKIAASSVRLAASRGVQVGTNQQDGSTLSPPQLAVAWNNMQTLPDSGPGTPNFPAPPYNALAVPLRTGDVRVATAGGTVTPGQVCVQQTNPLPCNIVALFSEVLPGDVPQAQAPQKQPRR